MIFYGWYGNFWIDRIPPRRLNVAILKFSLMYRQDRQWCGFSTHAAPVGYIVHACCLSYIGIFYSIRLHSARMLPLLGIYSIRLHSARMLPLLGAACVEKPHHWRSCLYILTQCLITTSCHKGSVPISFFPSNICLSDSWHTCGQ